jgi:two-component system chemotaxis response regulator CheY
MGPKILIVDDSSLARRTLRHLLESAGYEVIEADEGALALERYVLDQPRLVLLDLVMKGMYGLDVLGKLRELDAQACVIVATADVQHSTRQMVEEAGAQAIVNKPFIKQQVLGAIETALEGNCHGAKRTSE